MSNITSLLKGFVRNSENTEKAVSVSPKGDLFMVKTMPDYSQLVAEGRVWRAQEASATASVVSLPTTAGLFTLGNNEGDDGLWYVLLACYASNTANAVALDSYGLALNISHQPALTGGIDVSLARDIAATSIKSMLGGIGTVSPYQGKAILDTGVTVTDDLWFPVGNASGSTAINSATGGSMWVWLNGIVVLKPKALISIVSTATSTSNTTRKGFVWAEVPKSYLSI